MGLQILPSRLPPQEWHPAPGTHWLQRTSKQACSHFKHSHPCSQQAGTLQLPPSLPLSSLHRLQDRAACTCPELPSLLLSSALAVNSPLLLPITNRLHERWHPYAVPARPHGPFGAFWPHPPVGSPPSEPPPTHTQGPLHGFPPLTTRCHFSRACGVSFSPRPSLRVRGSATIKCQAPSFHS